MLRVTLLTTFLSVSFATMVGCSSADKKADTAEGAYNIAEEYDKSERYEEAIRRFQEVKNKFPYSKFATMAELAIADVYFKQESFPEAQIAYQTFKDMHPKHSQADYVTFRLGLSYFNQLPETVDRDLSLATNTIGIFDDLLRDFPTSQYLAEAKAKREKAILMLAQKEEYIADFYFIRKKFDSALTRYEGILRRFTNLGLDAKALARAAVSAAKVGDQDKARKYLTELEGRFPGSQETEFAKKEIR